MPLVPLADLTLKPGLVIAQSAKVAPRTYAFANADESWTKPVVRVKGKDIVVDFKGATLQGSQTATDPDQRKGLGVLVEGENITVRNLKVRGYKVALLARGVKGLKLVNCDFSYNWKQRLLSDPEKEDLADWMSFHHNEKGEWLRYGAGAYLDGCSGFEVKGLKVNGGQCGLLLNRSDGGLVWNCDLSFNSALGLGMYRSSDNRVMHNKMDWCVRGYSHGVYNRGQDSAGILTFEQCHRNVFAYNSATHGGDGFFLWAGQHTMDTGQGGCNDNLLYGNDLSHSPANAIEATFSRNKFVNNLLIDNWHGVWGGYSYDTLIEGNIFAYNGESIAIEHGQDNIIARNRFVGDTVSVYLWQNANPPDPNWGYPKHRDTRNRGTVVQENAIADVADTALHLGMGQNIRVQDNAVARAAKGVRIEGKQEGVQILENALFVMETAGATEGVTMADNAVSTWPGPALKAVVGRGGGAIPANEPPSPQYEKRFEFNWDPTVPGRFAGQPKPMANGQDPFIPKGAPRGRKYMIIDEWGPYDFKRPLLWPREKVAAATSSINSEGQTSRRDWEGHRFDVLGPNGKWRVVWQSKGLVIDKKSGTVPGSVTVQWPSDTQQIDLVLEYVGGATTDVRGNTTRAGKAVKFGWNRTRIPVSWDVKFWDWNESRDPRTHYAAFLKWMDTQPLAQFTGSELNFASGGSPHANVPGNNFATLATGEVTVEAGTYLVNVVTDDGIKLWLDDKLLLDEWHWQGPTPYTREVKLTKGRHKLRVEHFEIDGYTALKVEIKPKR